MRVVLRGILANDSSQVAEWTSLLKEIRHNPLLWLLALVLAAQVFKPEAHVLLFVLSVAAIVPLAALAQPRNRVRGGQDGRYQGCGGPELTHATYN